MSTHVHPERETKRQEQGRRNRLTALFAGIGTGVVLALLTGLLLESWPFAIGLGVAVSLAVTFGLNAIRRDSRELVDETPESDA